MAQRGGYRGFGYRRTLTVQQVRQRFFLASQNIRPAMNAELGMQREYLADRAVQLVRMMTRGGPNSVIAASTQAITNFHPATTSPVAVLDISVIQPAQTLPFKVRLSAGQGFYRWVEITKHAGRYYVEWNVHGRPAIPQPRYARAMWVPTATTLIKRGGAVVAELPGGWRYSVAKMQEDDYMRLAGVEMRRIIRENSRGFGRKVVKRAGL